MAQQKKRKAKALRKKRETITLPYVLEPGYRVVHAEDAKRPHHQTHKVSVHRPQGSSRRK